MIAANVIPSLSVWKGFVGTAATVLSISFRHSTTSSRVQPGGDPVRFRFLPFPLLEPSHREARRVLGELGFGGICLTSIVNEQTLDELDFEPLLEDLERYGARLLLRPIGASGDALGLPATSTQTFPSRACSPSTGCDRSPESEHPLHIPVA